MKKFTPFEEKKSRNQEIYLAIATGIPKDDVCKKWKISLTQLNRILREGRVQTEQWFKSLPSQFMASLFRYTCSNAIEEIHHLEFIRDQIKDDPKTEFDMTLKIFNTYLNYSKMIAEGPTLARQKELTEEVEKSLA